MALRFGVCKPYDKGVIFYPPSRRSTITSVDGHPRRYNYEVALILYLFDIDLVLIPPHTSHLLQDFDMVISAPLKKYFKEEILFERFDYYLLNGFKNSKQTARDLRKSI